MNVFISWSGSRSHRVAEALERWLPYVFQSVRPWVSSEGVRAGSRWSVELAKVLDKSDFAVLCVTRENLAAPWLIFEAGVLSKALEDGKVVPYLIDLPPAELTGPLAQFQAVMADREGTRKLVQAISASHSADMRSEHVLRNVFEKFWPELEPELGHSAKIETETFAAAPDRSDPPPQQERQRPSRTKTTEDAFLRACPSWARKFFEGLWQEAVHRRLTIHWGSKGFSIRAYRPNGQYASVLYGYPPGAMGMSAPYLEVYLKYLGDADDPGGLRASVASLGGWRSSGQQTLRFELTERTVSMAKDALPQVWPVYERIKKNA